MNKRQKKIMVPYEEKTDTCQDCSNHPCDCGIPAGYTPTPRTDDYEAYSEWLHKHMTKKGRTHWQIKSLMTSGTGLLLFEVWEAAIEKSQRELANAMASASTYREQYEASEMNIKNLMHYVKGLPHHVSISSPAIPIRDALILLHIDKADIETKWEELCIAVGAHGSESDPLLGTDTNDDIHKRAMEKIRELAAVTEQRDRLAEALREVATYDPSDGQCNSGYSCKYIAEQSLQSLNQPTP